PVAIVSDDQRLKQILKNLLSNAFKFTHAGGVILSLGPAPEGAAFNAETLRSAERVIAFTVTDTGVGIPDDKLGAIFEAFQQADGTTSRKYGGTGLGLSISREIARLLGGEIDVRSSLGRGSSFTLFLPLTERSLELTGDAPQLAPLAVPEVAFVADEESMTFPDDLRLLDPDDRPVLVIDGDAERSRHVLEILHGKGSKAILTPRPTAALALAREHRPSAVLLAGDLPRVEVVLGQLKKHPDTRHLPVIVVGSPVARIDALRAGAAAHLDEPLEEAALDAALERVARLLEQRTRRIALVQRADGPLDGDLAEMIGAEEIDVIRIDPEAAFEALKEDPEFDLGVAVLDRFSHNGVLALLGEINADVGLRELPLVAYVAGELPRTERARLDALAKSAVVSVVDSPERLVDRAALFLHRAEAQLPTPTRRMLGRLRTGDAPLQGKKVLVVDDDIRNVFALTSTLEQRGMKVVFAENGREGIERLHQHPNTDLVLLDIMMPEMDGYETARAIRSMPRFEHLPIISLTAKAMKGDREKSIAAGASDYITKPVDTDQLVAMMRVWLDA
ncbi:MAG TPA: response regulator, partial [Solirubrobacteraceae bacterium]|nr:response regulator [Solirubrobacteraceae bacterium]